MDTDTIISSLKFGGLSGKHTSPEAPEHSPDSTNMLIQQDVPVSFMAVHQVSCAHQNIQLCIRLRMESISVFGGFILVYVPISTPAFGAYDN